MTSSLFLSSNKEDIEEETSASRERTNQNDRQFVQISFEIEAKKQFTVLKEKFVDDEASASTSSFSQQEEHDNVFVKNWIVSLDKTIKCEAI